MAGKLARAETETPGYAPYPRDLDRHKDRIFGIGEEMYGHLGIPRADTAARRTRSARAPEGEWLRVRC